MLDLPTLDNDWRAQLHAELDRVIDRRLAIESEAGVSTTPNALSGLLNLSCSHLWNTEVGKQARDLFKEVASLAADCLGSSVRSMALQRGHTSNSERRSEFLNWLYLVEPLLSAPMPSALSSAPHQVLAPYEVFSALYALDAGEVRSIFEPKKVGNKPKNIYSLAHARFEALKWKKKLILLGHEPGPANVLITNAFGETWDTIYRWKKSCVDALGETYVGFLLAHSRKEAQRYVDQPPAGLLGAAFKRDPIKDLERDGGVYKAERRRAAELSPRKNKRSEK